MAKVEVKPIDRKKWHGKKGQESFAAPATYEVLYNETTGRYATGLTEEEAREYGNRMGVDLSDTFIYDQPHPYWSSKASWMVLPNHTLILDTNKAPDYVRHKNMLSCPFVANSMKEYEEGKWPEATHVIFNEELEVEVRAVKAQQRLKALKILAEMSTDAQAALILIINGKVVKGRNNNFIDVEMDDILQNKPGEFLKWVERGKEDVTSLATVLEAIQRGILTRQGEKVMYMGEALGFGPEGAAKWFRETEDQRLKVAILEKLNK